MDSSVHGQSFIVKALKEVYKKLFVLILALVIGVGGGLAYYFFKDKPTYTATKTVMLITNMTKGESTYQPSNDVTLAKIYLTDVSSLIKSPSFIETANEVYSAGGYSGKIGSGNISTKYSADSLIFKISYTDSTKENIDKKLEAVIASARTNLDGKIMAQDPDLKDLQVKPTISVNKNITRDILFGTVIGIVIGIGVIYLLYILDNTVRDKEEFEKITGVICLSHIEDVTLLEKKKGAKLSLDTVTAKSDE